ncbi:hypothetical protein Y032_0100g3241 [Ancylostoma ceylanicum]|uniref:Uncharacterized protein n=1 Tax=Ancylostoma ceylanicum TaxID=53326 RepID=A0A016TI35_9BILA|nr:hypothetical protein Y032_0100g3241 [Ancylostoma ceylanicum]
MNGRSDRAAEFVNDAVRCNRGANENDLHKKVKQNHNICVDAVILEDIKQVMSSPYGGHAYTDGGQRWRGGSRGRGRRSSDFHAQQFASPYQSGWNTPNDGSGQRRSYGRGSPASHFQANQGAWKNNGRSSYGSPRGTPDSYKNKNQYRQQEVDIRDYVIPAMTGNPWKKLEEQWKSERTSAGIDTTASS